MKEVDRAKWRREGRTKRMREKERRRKMRRDKTVLEVD